MRYAIFVKQRIIKLTMHSGIHRFLSRFSSLYQNGMILVAYSIFGLLDW